MTRSYSRRKPLSEIDTTTIDQLDTYLTPKSSKSIPPTGKIFLGEEDKKLLQKFNKHIVNKLGLEGNRSIKL